MLILSCFLIDYITKRIVEFFFSLLFSGVYVCLCLSLSLSFAPDIDVYVCTIARTNQLGHVKCKNIRAKKVECEK